MCEGFLNLLIKPIIPDWLSIIASLIDDDVDNNTNDDKDFEYDDIDGDNTYESF